MLRVSLNLPTVNDQQPKGSTQNLKNQRIK
jgi:hypothetical protein